MKLLIGVVARSLLIPFKLKLTGFPLLLLVVATAAAAAAVAAATASWRYLEALRRGNKRKRRKGEK